ncbi:MAG: hypothetical protein HUK25_00285 [Treponema sp.]|nr:hypothetical protein [Treponema sp.]
MSNMSICACCGRTLDAAFVFCPWCGKSRVSVKDESSVSVLSQSRQEKKDIDQLEKIEEIGKRIENLEKELSVLVLSVEMSK